MKTQRKLIAAILIVILSLLFTGCGEDPNAPKEVKDIEMTTKIGYYEDNNEVVYIDAKEGTYTGTVVNGIPNGEGIFTTKNSEGVTYEVKGIFVNGNIDGPGITTWEDGYFEKGLYTDGLFTPTKSELIDNFLLSYDLYGNPEASSTALSFIDEHENLFPNSDEKDVKEYMDTDCEIRKLMKTVSGFDDALMYLENGYVVQAEEENYCGYVITELLVGYGDGDVATVFLLGKADYYRDDTVQKLYALPLATASYESVSEKTVRCAILFGSYIE